ncbi:MAG: hypothetical protein IPH76_12045 [Xanthomonadales bacterium]|nr:hypothetical protein [Xanthomonadales bacterium]
MGHSAFLTVLVGQIQCLVVATPALELFAYTRALIRAERRDSWVMVFLMVVAFAWSYTTN